MDLTNIIAGFVAMGFGVNDAKVLSSTDRPLDPINFQITVQPTNTFSRDEIYPHVAKLVDNYAENQCVVVKLTNGKPQPIGNAFIFNKAGHVGFPYHFINDAKTNDTFELYQLSTKARAKLQILAYSAEFDAVVAQTTKPLTALKALPLTCILSDTNQYVFNISREVHNVGNTNDILAIPPFEGLGSYVANKPSKIQTAVVAGKNIGFFTVNSQRFFQTYDFASKPGMSGTPTFDMAGRLVGLLATGDTNSAPNARNMSYGTPMPAYLQLIQASATTSQK
jgi:S1-C subfamily serine protease